MSNSENKILKKQALRQSILDFAENIASTEGWEAVTMRRISAEIKYSLPIIYNHFKNKEDIITVLAVKGFKILLETLKATIESGKDVKKIAIDLALAYLDFAKTHKALYLAMYGQESVSTFLPTNLQEGEKVFDFIYVWLEALTKQKIAFIPNVWESTKLVWATLHGLVALDNINQINDTNTKVEKLATDFVNILIDRWEIV